MTKINKNHVALKHVDRKMMKKTCLPEEIVDKSSTINNCSMEIEKRNRLVGMKSITMNNSVGTLQEWFQEE